VVSDINHSDPTAELTLLTRMGGTVVGLFLCPPTHDPVPD